jgi:hypothetical protein
MKKILVLCALACLSGCGTAWTIGKAENGAPLSFTTDTTPKEVTQINVSNTIGVASSGTPPVSPPTPPLSSVQARELADTLLNQSDINCQNYLTGVSWINNATTASLDFAALTLSSIAPITSPARAAAILSAGSAVSTGSKQLLSNDLLGGKDYGLIHDAVIDGRIAERKIIQVDIDSGKFDDWSAYAILSHVQPYHYDCGIEFGLKYLREALVTQTGPKLNPSVQVVGVQAPDVNTNASAALDAAKLADANANAADKTSADAKTDAALLVSLAQSDDAAAQAAVPGSADAAAKSAAAAKAHVAATTAQAHAAALANADASAQAAKVVADGAAAKAAASPPPSVAGATANQQAPAAPN